MAPLDFKHMTSADYKPGETDEVKYYAQKRKKQYHGNESVQSADRKPEKYMKPDGKVGVRMVKTDKEIVKKEASVLKPTKPSDITKHARTLAKNPGDYERNKKKYIDKARAKVFRMYPREEVEEATWPDEHPQEPHENCGTENCCGTCVEETTDTNEALNMSQRIKRSRLMKRLKTRIKIGRQRAMRKMANKKTLEKRSNRQARAQIAKKLTRGIPKGELTFARKQEIEKRLDKPALKQRIARLAKRMFKDVRKKEVQRKKG